MIESINDIFFSSEEESKEIVFVGDSIVRGYDLDKFFPDIKNKVVNCGLAGATTEALFYILKQGIVKRNPKIVIMLIGTNDINDIYHRRNQEIIFNIARIIIELKIILKKVNIGLISILLCDEIRFGKGSLKVGVKENIRIIEINNRLKEFENYFKDFIFIDVYDKFLNKEGSLDDFLAYDGLHLNANGYNKLTEFLNPIIRELN